MPRTCVVSFPGPTGEYSYVTGGDSVLDAAANALKVFDGDWWKGPRPGSRTGKH